MSEQFDAKVLQFQVDINALAATTGRTTVDKDGNPIVLPQGFIVDGGFVLAADGVANNTLDIGIDSGDEDAFVDGLDIAAGPVRTDILATGKGLANTARDGLTVVVKNVGSAAIPSAETIVTLSFVGHYDFTV